MTKSKTKPEDPIFERLIRHAAALKAEKAAARKVETIEAKLPDRQRFTDATVQYRNAYAFTSRSDVGRHVEHQIREIGFTLGAVGERALKASAPKIRRALERLYDDAQTAHAAHHKRIGLTAARVKWRKAAREEHSAMMMLCRYKPRTSGGLVALIRYLRPLYEAGRLDEVFAASRLFQTLYESSQDVMTRLTGVVMHRRQVEAAAKRKRKRGPVKARAKAVPSAVVIPLHKAA